MSRLTKLFKHPVKFFKDAAKKKRELARLAKIKAPVFAFRIHHWKRSTIEAWLPDKTLIYVPFKTKSVDLKKKWLPLIEKTAGAEILVWGMNLPPEISHTTKPIRFVEDGFIRSIGLGSKHVPPLSLNFDYKTAYFDARKESDLEYLLSTYDFSSDPNLIERARKNIVDIVSHGLSKYNSARRIDARKIYPAKKDRKRILVVGQVEDDASIIYGCDVRWTNNDVVKLAVFENPDAEVHYKPHPDVLHGKRKAISNLEEVQGLCYVITENIALADVLETIDHVYTITSQVGIEALVRKIRVTTIGCPFYAGWGLTDDRQENTRRKRKLTIEELFAGAYILYPEYFDPIYKKPATIESTIAAIRQLLEKESEIEVERYAGAVSINRESDQSLLLAQDDSAPYRIPDWYKPGIGSELNQAAKSGKPVYFYIPWGCERSDSIIGSIRCHEYEVLPVEFFPIAGNDKEKAIDFIDANPVFYRKMVVGSLTPFCNNVAGIIFASDCAPPMRIISHVCRELDIPRILIPYESAPLDDGVYYRDARTLVSFPSADVVLGWDDRQKEVFTKRGYPEAQFLSVGSLSLDEYVNYDARLSRQQFSRLFGLEPEKKIILLVIQSLMLSSRTGAAFAAQKDAVLDMVELSRLLGMQLLIRLPRFADNVMDSDMLAVLNDADHVATDDSTFCMVSFEEAVFHSDFVSSIGGGGVAEAKLMGKATLSLEYFDFTRNWASVDTAVVRNRSELAESLDKFLSYESLCEVEEVGNSTALLTPDCADGLASSRIQALLKENAFGGDLWAKPRGPFELMLKKQAIDVVAIPSSKAVLESVQVYVKDMLVANSLISSKGDINTIADLVAVDVFVQWGISDSKSKKHQRSIAKQLGRKVVYIEDGFIRSSSIGLSGEAGLSLVIDDLTAHYDAVRPSRMELILQHGPVIDDAGKQRASDAIELIKNTRISKYNHAPDVEVSIGSPSRRKILVVDQRYGDQSVVSGLGSVQVFRQMLEDAVADNPDADILVKRHPDAIGGSKSSYYSDENISAEMCADNIYLIDFDVNPFRLLELASDVYVVTSGMGFEALMAGKTVHCYGVPFYSGWGLTKDRVSLDRRSRVRSLEEIFYVSYIQLSRYYSPVLGRACELEDILDYFSLVGRQCAFSEKCTSLYA